MKDRVIKCKICSNNCKSFKDKEFGKNYFHCKKCQFIFLDEKFIVSKVNEKKQYENHNNSMENIGYVNMFKDFISKTIIPHKNNIKTALDFGCGTSAVLAELLKIEQIETDIYDLYFSPQKVYENKQYDLITSTEVFEHLKNPMDIINLLKNHLTYNGYLAIMTQFHTDKIDDFLKWWYRRDPTHISFYTPKTFKMIAKLQGFEYLFNDSKKVILLKKIS